ISNQEPIGQPSPVGVPKEAQRKERTTLQRQHYGEPRCHSTDFFVLCAHSNKSKPYNKDESGEARITSSLPGVVDNDSKVLRRPRPERCATIGNMVAAFKNDPGEFKK